NAVTVYEDDFRNSRLGAMLFDLHYINKHPIIGNGFHISTRYEDYPYLLLIMNEGEDLGHGNGFSNYLASMGIPFMIGYLCLIFASMVKVDKKFAFLIVSIVFLNLQGEQWLNFPLFLGLVFANFSKASIHERSFSEGSIFLKLETSRKYFHST